MAGKPVSRSSSPRSVGRSSLAMASEPPAEPGADKPSPTDDRWWAEHGISLDGPGRAVRDERPYHRYEAGDTAAGVFKNFDLVERTFSMCTDEQT